MSLHEKIPCNLITYMLATPPLGPRPQSTCEDVAALALLLTEPHVPHPVVGMGKQQQHSYQEGMWRHNVLQRRNVRQALPCNLSWPRRRSGMPQHCSLPRRAFDPLCGRQPSSDMNTRGILNLACVEHEARYDRTGSSFLPPCNRIGYRLGTVGFEK